MALNLNNPISWSRPLANESSEDSQWIALLCDLQGNILKGHGRLHTANVFLQFKSTEGARSFMCGIGADVTTALQQLVDAAIHRATGKSTGSFVGAMLTAKGYDALGVLADQRPAADAFVAGMASRSLGDASVDEWEAPFQSEIHAMLLLAADNSADPLDPSPREALLNLYIDRVAKTGGAVQVVGVDRGDQLLNDAGHGIEHFGYVDGRSQPLALIEDIRRELPNGSLAGVWDPTIPVSQLILRDPAGSHETSFGSYFVYRKLEQDVRRFKLLEEALSKGSNNGELAGASVVGRYENGFPVLTGGGAKTAPALPGGEIPNDFDFTLEHPGEEGLKCPFAAHIRKTNPRRADSQGRLMARRGITYGDRKDDPGASDPKGKPTGGVGLLFMSYQSDIEGQFEFTQNAWANNPNFDFLAPAHLKPVGIDPLIGQPEKAGPQQFLGEWGAALAPRSDFSGVVRMKGGQYFFAPSVSALKGLTG